MAAQDVRRILEGRAPEWTGRRLTTTEAGQLRSSLGALANPEWLDLLQEFSLVGAELVLRRDQNPSRRGVTAAVMGPKSLLVEALESYPGRLASSCGLIPFGTCLAGSGDPYFLRFQQPWMVFRVLHDACDAKAGAIATDGIEPILPLAELLALARIT